MCLLNSLQCVRYIFNRRLTRISDQIRRQQISVIKGLGLRPEKLDGISLISDRQCLRVFLSVVQSFSAVISSTTVMDAKKL